MNIEELKAKVKALKDANDVKIREAAEVARLEATLKLESSKELFKARVKMAAISHQTASLQSLVDECAEIVASVPVYNQKTRNNRVWAGTHRYNMGNQIDLLYQLATGILYACAEHKQLLLTHTGLDMEAIQTFVDAFGTPSYYSRNYHTIVEAKPYQVDVLQSAVAVLQSELGVVVNTSALTEDNLKAEYDRAEVTAKNNFDLAEEAINDADLVL
jgi:hypothetical protein